MSFPNISSIQIPDVIVPSTGLSKSYLDYLCTSLTSDLLTDTIRNTVCETGQTVN